MPASTIQALNSWLPLPLLGSSLMRAIGLVIGVSILFRNGIKHCTSALS